MRLSVLAAAADVAEETGARDVAAWYAHETLTEPDAARSDLRLARALDRDWPQLAGALAAGRCSVAQARVIVRSLEELQANLNPNNVPMTKERTTASTVIFTLVHIAWRKNGSLKICR